MVDRNTLSRAFTFKNINSEQFAALSVCCIADRQIYIQTGIDKGVWREFLLYIKSYIKIQCYTATTHNSRLLSTFYLYISREDMYAWELSRRHCMDKDADTDNDNDNAAVKACRTCIHSTANIHRKTTDRYWKRQKYTAMYAEDTQTVWKTDRETNRTCRLKTKL